MGSSLLFHFKKGQRVKNVLGIGCGKIVGQKIRSRPVQHWRAGLFHIEAMLANAFPQSSNVLTPCDRNRYEPAASQQQHDPADLPLGYTSPRVKSAGSCCCWLAA